RALLCLFARLRLQIADERHRVTLRILFQTADQRRLRLGRRHPCHTLERAVDLFAIVFDLLSSSLQLPRLLLEPLAGLPQLQLAVVEAVVSLLQLFLALLRSALPFVYVGAPDLELFFHLLPEPKGFVLSLDDDLSFLGVRFPLCLADQSGCARLGGADLGYTLPVPNEVSRGDASGQADDQSDHKKHRIQLLSCGPASSPARFTHANKKAEHR